MFILNSKRETKFSCVEPDYTPRKKKKQNELNLEKDKAKSKRKKSSGKEEHDSQEADNNSPKVLKKTKTKKGKETNVKEFWKSVLM